MADYSSINIGSEWVDVVEAAGLPSGIEFDVQNRGISNILLAYDTKPAEGSTEGLILTKGGSKYSKAELAATGWSKLYARTAGAYPNRLTIIDRSLKRYITSLSAAGGMYYELSEPVVLNIGDSLTIRAAMLNVPWSTLISAINRFGEIRVNADGTVDILSGVDVYLDGVIINDDTIFPTDNAIHEWYIVSNVDGLSYRYVGIRDTLTNSMTGEIESVVAVKDGETILDMPIDEDWTKGNVVRNRAAVLGDNFNSDGFNDSNSYSFPVAGWTVSDGLATCDGSFNALLDVGGLSIDNSDTFLVEYTIEEGSTGSVRAAIYGQGLVGLGKDRNGSGTYTEIVKLSVASTSSTNSIRLQNRGDFVGSISNYSVRKIPSGYPYATAINVTENEAEKFTKVDGGTNWLGENEYVTLSQIWQWSGEESNYAFKTLRTDQTVYLFRESLDLTSGVSGQLKIQSSASGGSAFKNAGDVYIRDISHGTSNTLLQTSAGASKYIGESKSSLKRLIPIAGGA